MEARPIRTKRWTEAIMPDNTTIRSFQVSFPDTDVTELRRRVKMTRWPEHELVSDAVSRRIWSTPAAVGPTQGVQLAETRAENRSPAGQPGARPRSADR